MSARAAPPLLLLALALSACGQATGAPGAGEQGEDPDRQDFPLELGAGEAAFRPLADGEPFRLVPGFQGLQHVLGSVRAWDIPEDRYVVSLELVREEDGEQVSEPARTRVPLLEQAGGYVEITGLRAVVPAPAAVVGEPAWLRVEVVGPDDAIARARARAVVEWAPEGYDPDGG